MSEVGKSRLHTMTLMGPTEFWNDSCSAADLTYAIDNGATGGTSNPFIVADVLKKELDNWKPRIISLINQNPTANEDHIAWKLVEEITISAAKLLKPIFDQSKGRTGRLSLQTDAKNYRNEKAIVEQGLYFHSLYPNNNIKLAITKAGVQAIEELSYQGVSINATVSFTVPQVIAAAEAVERGLTRRQKEGKDISGMSPVCTIMPGRLDDWLKTQVAKKGIITEPGYLEFAGVAAAKKAYRLFMDRGYRTRLLIAALRNHYHWSQFIGGEVSITIPIEWQKKINGSDIEVKKRMDDPVDPKIITELEKKFPDFCRAYDEKGMKPDEFEFYGATRQMFRDFLGGYTDLVTIIRNILIPDPAVKGE